MDDEADRLNLPAAVITDELDVGATGFEERELPHCLVVLAGAGLLDIFEGRYQALLKQRLGELPLTE